MDPTKQVQWQKLAKQSSADMEALRNLELLGVPISKKSAGAGLWFGSARKRTFRKVKRLRGFRPKPCSPLRPMDIEACCMYRDALSSFMSRNRIWIWFWVRFWIWIWVYRK